MRIPRIYCPQVQQNQDYLELGNTASLHVCKVLRLKSGDPLLLFDGQGNSFTAIIETASNKKAIVQLVKMVTENTESNLTLHLGLGLSKGDRMDYAIQKAVEVGVTHITPLVTKFGVIKLDKNRQHKKYQHWSSIIISACEQSGRALLPVLNPISPLKTWLEHDTGHKLIFDPEADMTLSKLKQNNSVSVLIGPEGGLCPTEIDMAVAQDFKRVRLGPRILRTETAAAVACAAIQTIWGDYANL